MDKVALTALVEKFYATDVDFPGSLGSTRGATLIKRSGKPTIKKSASAKVVKKSGVKFQKATKQLASRSQISR
jgi:hypothetical protein